jgi:hypothetical protein
VADWTMKGCRCPPEGVGWLAVIGSEESGIRHPAWVSPHSFARSEEQGLESQRVLRFDVNYTIG